MENNNIRFIVWISVMFILPFSVLAQIGTRFPSERKVVKDTVTGVDLVFLTSEPMGDSKIYPTHNQWTSDGQWVIFRSRRVRGEAMAVNESMGDIVQVTEGGFNGTLCVARKTMKLYFMRKLKGDEAGSVAIYEVDLQKLFKDIESGNLDPADKYQQVCVNIPASYHAETDMALDADEDWIYFKVGKKAAKKHLSKKINIEKNYGPRNMGAGPGGIAAVNFKTGELKHVVSVGFQVGHIQTNPWVPGEIVFCWETGGKSPQRTWIVNADGTGLRPLYPEAPFEWVTHEAVISPDEVAFAIMGHRPVPSANNNISQKPSSADAAEDKEEFNPGQETAWGECGTREKPTGLAIVNIQTREMHIAGQIPHGSGFWHVTGSPDGRFAAGDDFDRNLYLINRESGEMILLSSGHKRTARDHVHPTFSPDGTKIEIQSAMLSEDGKNMNICIVPVPEEWLNAKEK